MAETVGIKLEVDATQGVKTLGALEAQQEKMGRSYTSGVQGLQEDYVGDWLGQVGKLGQMGATICKPNVEEWCEDSKSCIKIGEECTATAGGD